MHLLLFLLINTLFQLTAELSQSSSAFTKVVYAIMFDRGGLGIP